MPLEIKLGTMGLGRGARGPHPKFKPGIETGKDVPMSSIVNALIKEDKETGLFILRIPTLRPDQGIFQLRNHELEQIRDHSEIAKSLGLQKSIIAIPLGEIMSYSIGFHAVHIWNFHHENEACLQWAVTEKNDHIPKRIIDALALSHSIRQSAEKPIDWDSVNLSLKGL